MKQKCALGQSQKPKIQNEGESVTSFKSTQKHNHKRQFASAIDSMYRYFSPVECEMACGRGKDTFCHSIARQKCNLPLRCGNGDPRLEANRTRATETQKARRDYAHWRRRC